MLKLMLLSVIFAISYSLLTTLLPSFLSTTPSFSAAAHADVIFGIQSFVPLLYGMYYLACALYICHKEEIRMAATGDL